jgi:O-antigen chain-terminating methyltransferase
LDDTSPDLVALRRKLDEEDAAYAGVLAAIDALATFPLPLEKLPELPAQMARLNTLWQAPTAPRGSGLAGRAHRGIWGVMAPALERQAEFNATVVQIVNGQVDETARLHGRLRDLVAALMRYLQRVLPVMDARDRMASALATSRAELILEAFDRRQESLGRRLEGLLALRDRLEAVSEEVRAVRGTLASPPAPPTAAAAERAAADSAYIAFENRYRGSRDEIRERLASYVKLFDGLAPVADLGCGRGEFLELLKEHGIAARGVEGNAALVREGLDRGLDVTLGDLLSFLRTQDRGSLGGVFAAQVAEHLPPRALQETLRESHRVLRPGGLLVLETVNPRSVIAFLEIYNRDLTHEKPLHPDTLSFLAAAAGFSEVRVELRAPVDAATRLQAVPNEDLPPRVAEVLNENLRKLNDFLYAPQEYVLLARR